MNKPPKTNIENIPCTSKAQQDNLIFAIIPSDIEIKVNIPMKQMMFELLYATKSKAEIIISRKLMNNAKFLVIIISFGS